MNTEDEFMRKTRNRLIAWLLSVVMVLSLLLNVNYNAEAEENVVTLPGTTVKVYTYVNGVQSDITADTVLRNGDQVKLVLGWQVNNTEGIVLLRRQIFSTIWHIVVLFCLTVVVLYCRMALQLEHIT